MRNKLVIESLEIRRLLATFAATSGVTYTGTADSGAGNSYTIDAEAGEQLIVQLNPQSNAYVEVWGPGESVLYSLGGWARTISLTLASAGTHRVQITEPVMSQVNYAVTLFVASQTQGGDETAAAVSGERKAWTVASADLDILYADLETGDNVFVALSEASAGALDPRMQIVDPSGAILDTIDTETGTADTFVAAATGRFHFVMSGQTPSATGTYGVTIGTVPGAQDTTDPDTAALAPGVIRSAELLTGDLDIFSFDVEAGTQAIFSLAPTNGASLDPDVFIYNAAGTEVTRQTAAQIAITLNPTETQSYFAVIRDETGLVGGTYDFSYTTSLTNQSLQLIDNVLTVEGTSGDDHIVISREGDTYSLSGGALLGELTTTFATSISIRGGDGNDKVILTDAGLPAYVSGGSGDDSILGSALNDSLTGGGGRNRIYGNDGDDRLNGSAGRDFFFGGGGADRLYGNGGNDALDGGGQIDRLYGGDGDDLLIGGGSNDKLYAGAGNDTLFGGTGRDLLSGELGTDSARSDLTDVLDSIEVTL